MARQIFSTLYLFSYIIYTFILVIVLQIQLRSVISWNMNWLPFVNVIETLYH